MRRTLLYATFAGLLLTGLTWAGFHYFVAPRQAAAFEAATMKLHGGFAMLGLVMLGSLLPEHVARGWKGSKNRLSGTAMLIGCAFLIATGYLLYYAGGEELHRLASYIHLAFGVGFAVLGIAHATARLRSS